MPPIARADAGRDRTGRSTYDTCWAM
jgi:hypothetical protein